MQFSLNIFDKKNTINKLKTGCIAVGIYENNQLTPAAKALDQQGAISEAIASGDISGKAGTTLLLRDVAGVAAKRVLLVGLGAEASMNDKDFLLAVESIVRVFSTLGTDEGVVGLPFDNSKDQNIQWAVTSSVLVGLPYGNPNERNLQWTIRAFVLATHEHAYRSDSLKQEKEPAPAGVKKIVFAVAGADADKAEQTLAQSIAIANGVNLTKDLGNLPGNICTPTYLADTAKKLAKDYRLEL